MSIANLLLMLGKMSEAGANNEPLGIDELGNIYDKIAKQNKTPKDYIRDSLNEQAPTEEQVKSRSVNTNFFQQLGHAIIGKDDPNESKSVWGYAGETLGDMIRGQAGLDTTNQRTKLTPTDQFIATMTGQVPGGQNIYSDDAEKAFGNYLNSSAMEGYPQTEYTTAEGTAMGKLFGQTKESKDAQSAWMARYNQVLDIDKTMKTDEGKKLGEKFGEASRVLQALRNLNGIGKAMDEDFPGGGSPYAYLVGGAANLPIAPSRLQKYAEPVLAYNAQMQETKISSLPILSGQARYVVDLARAIQETIPDSSRIGTVRGTLSAQSVRNMMTLVYGIQNGYFGANRLMSMGIDPNSKVKNKGEMDALLGSVKLSDEQEKNIEEAVDYVINAPAIRKGKRSESKDKSFKSLWE